MSQVDRTQIERFDRLSQGRLSGLNAISKLRFCNELSSETALVIQGEDRSVAVETIEQRSTARKHAPRYRVLLHNDDFNSMEYVVEVLVKTVANLTIPQAVNIMMEAHTNGVALVITCAQEHAEFYCETLKNHGLTSTIEPEES